MTSRPTLEAAAAELAAELPSEVGPEAIDRLAADLGRIRPDTTARGRQRAAAKALGFDPPMTAAEAERIMAEPTAGSRARRQARGLGRRTIRRVRRADSGDLVVTALGLVALYWVLRNPGAVTRLTDGVSRAFDWLVSPVPIGGAAPATNPSTGQNGSPIADDPEGRRVAGGLIIE